MQGIEVAIIERNRDGALGKAVARFVQQLLERQHTTMASKPVELIREGRDWNSQIVNIISVGDAMVQKHNTLTGTDVGSVRDTSTLTGADPNEQRMIWIVGGKVAVGQLFTGQAVVKRHVGEDTAVGCGCNVGRSEDGLEECAGTGGCQPPEIPIGAVLQAHAAGGWQRGEEHTTRPQQSIALAQRGAHVVDDVKSLREDDAVELPTLNTGGSSQIGHDRGPRVAVVDIDDFTADHARATETLSEIAFLNLEDGAPDVR